MSKAHTRQGGLVRLEGSPRFLRHVDGVQVLYKTAMSGSNANVDSQHSGETAWKVSRKKDLKKQKKRRILGRGEGKARNRKGKSGQGLPLTIDGGEALAHGLLRGCSDSWILAASCEDAMSPECLPI